MGSFNFYINVDQCLNMSNFDMFFYQLQRERRFHLSNVHFYDDKSNLSLTNAFHEIRSYMDKNPFLIRDYRLIFGMRKIRTQKDSWKESTLYRLLKIYYGLLDARLFIRSKDQADKNVTVILLHDTNLTLDTPSLEEYEILMDMEAFMSYIGIELNETTTDNDFYDKMKEFLDSKDEKANDKITRRFISDFFEKNKEYLTERTTGLEEFYEESAFDFPDEFGKIETYKKRESKRTTIHNTLYPLISFTQSCVGYYCVFQKEIDKNALDQNMLALLSLVDYITSDLKPTEKSKIHTNETLKEESKKNWKASNDDTGTQTRYGTMLFHYKNRLQDALDSMQKRLTEFTEGKAAPEFEEPEKLSADEGLNPKNIEYYEGEFKDMLKAFLKGSLRKDSALIEWQKAYRGLKEKLNKMEEELELYARNLSQKYKFQLEKRKIDALKKEEEGLYSQDDIIRKKEIFKKRQQEILNKLKSPKMNPSLTFQDQLNLENTLEKCNTEVTFFVRCQKMVKLVNFLILVALGGGLITLHHLIMQTYVFGNAEKLSVFLIFTVSAFVLYLFAWAAPYDFFQRKIRESMKELQRDMDVFISGYFQKAENFKDYINALNELDAIGSYVVKLEQLKDESDINSKKYLWHKVQIQEHLRKSSYFDDLIQSVNPYGIQDDCKHETKLDVQQDVIHNKLYWPQCK